jgi:hypothetical protein
MDGYTRAVSGQRLGKRVPVAMQQIFNNTTVELQQWKSYDFYVVRAEMLNKLCTESVNTGLDPAAEE